MKLLTGKRSFLKQIPEIIIFLSLCYFPLCHNIDAYTVRQWDEARNAIHTVEMRQNHNYLVRYFRGIPETWEPKPPLLIWLQVISSKVFGLNELALRLPIMLSTFMTVLLIVIFLRRVLKDRTTGYLAALILVTSQGYIDWHIARTGDHDGLLILITTAIILVNYNFLNTEKTKKFQYITLSLLFVVGVFAKSVAVFLVLPGLIISLFIFGKPKTILSDKWLYFGMIIFIIPVAAYYISREAAQPGYLNSVWQWELFPRYFNTADRFDSGNFWYYGQNFFKSRFTFWIWLLILSIILLPFFLKDSRKRFFLYILLNTVVLYLFVSFGSKAHWYDGPLFPLFAIIIALFLENIILKASGVFRDRSKYVSYLISAVIFIGIYWIPYLSIIRKVNRVDEYPWDREIFSMGYILREKHITDTLPDPLKVVFDGYNAHLLFYTESRNIESGTQKFILTDITGLISGDTILLSQQHVMDSIKRKYNCDIIFSDEPVKLVHITGR